MTEQTADRGVPGRVLPVVEFDTFSPEYAASWSEQLADLRTRCPVAYSNSHGGFWVPTRHEDIVRIVKDDATFSSAHDVGTGPGRRLGVGIPENVSHNIPIELDPPELEDYRGIALKHFSPAAAQRMRPRMTELADEFIDEFITRGGGDLVEGLAAPVPAYLTLEWLGLPLADWKRYSDVMHRIMYMTPADPEYPDLVAGHGWIVEQIEQTVSARRQDPRQDLISILAHSEIRGEPIPHRRLVDMIFLIIAGGVDTTTSLLANAFVILDRRPDLRRRLIDEPELMLTAREEFLRYVTPTQSLARTATVDTVLGDQRICPGDRVLVSWAAANHDPEAFPDPDQLILDRTPNRHLAFGVGMHRCLGSNIARQLFEVILGRVLDRLPDYQVGRDAQRYPAIGLVNGWVQVPVQFAPGRRLNRSGDASSVW